MGHEPFVWCLCHAFSVSHHFDSEFKVPVFISKHPEGDILYIVSLWVAL